MKKAMWYPGRVAVSLLIAALCSAAVAQAELAVSVTITGDLDEILAVLEQLDTMGVGASPADDDPFKLQMHSILPKLFDETVLLESPPEEPAPVVPPELPEPPPEPVLGLLEATVDPAVAKPGATVLLTVKVSDPDHRVDTVVATLGGSDGLGFDLYDNGTKGDAKAGDGIWSCAVPVPAHGSGGQYTVTVRAFDARGDLIRTPSPEGEEPMPLTTKTSFSVQP